MTDENNDPLSYYAQPGVMTDPGPYASLFDDLPREIPALCKIVQGNVLHVFWAERYEVTLSERRQQALQKRAVAQKLALLQRSTLARWRKPVQLSYAWPVTAGTSPPCYVPSCATRESRPGRAAVSGSTSCRTISRIIGRANVGRPTLRYPVGDAG